MVKPAVEAGVDMVTDVIKHIFYEKGALERTIEDWN